jgi:hypothetical protein
VFTPTGDFGRIVCSGGSPRIEGGFGRQLFPQTLFLFADARRDLDGDPDVKIAALGHAGGQPFVPDARLMSLLSACEDLI